MPSWRKYSTPLAGRLGHNLTAAHCCDIMAAAKVRGAEKFRHPSLGRLDHNLIGGQLPATWPGLPLQLRELKLNANKLTGRIKPTLALPPNLQRCAARGAPGGCAGAHAGMHACVHAGMRACGPLRGLSWALSSTRENYGAELSSGACLPARIWLAALIAIIALHASGRRRLNLANNALSGRIRKTWVLPSTLIQVDFSGNRFVGE